MDPNPPTIHPEVPCCFPLKTAVQDWNIDALQDPYYGEGGVGAGTINNFIAYSP